MGVQFHEMQGGWIWKRWRHSSLHEAGVVSVKEVGCNLFKDVEIVRKYVNVKKLQNQTVPTNGRLCDLWKEFKGHSKLDMAHHALTKWQRNCHVHCLGSFEDGDIFIETDFAEKYSHISKVNMMMPVYEQTTLMVALVHFGPQVYEGGGQGARDVGVDLRLRGREGRS